MPTGVVDGDMSPCEVRREALVLLPFDFLLDDGDVSELDPSLSLLEVGFLSAMCNRFIVQ